MSVFDEKLVSMGLPPLSGPPGSAVPQYDSGPVPSTPEGSPSPEASCEECDEDLYLDGEGQWQHLRQEIGGESFGHSPEPLLCSEVRYSGSRNPDSPRFGPDEQCFEVALPGTTRCSEHGE